MSCSSSLEKKTFIRSPVMFLTDIPAEMKTHSITMLMKLANISQSDCTIGVMWKVKYPFPRPGPVSFLLSRAKQLCKSLGIIFAPKWLVGFPVSHFTWPQKSLDQSRLAYSGMHPIVLLLVVGFYMHQHHHCCDGTEYSTITTDRQWMFAGSHWCQKTQNTNNDVKSTPKHISKSTTEVSSDFA